MMEVETMMQGDSYGLSIEILNEQGVVVTDQSVEDVEVTIGALRKTYSDGGVTFSNNKWVVPLTQEETFKFPAARIKAQVRVRWPGGNVEGVDLGLVNVRESLSKEVL